MRDFSPVTAVLTSSVSGTVQAGRFAGGLLGFTEHSSTLVVWSTSDATVVADELTGGLVGVTFGAIAHSSANGRAGVPPVEDAGVVGGLVGYTQGPVFSSYATTELVAPEAGDVALGALAAIVGEGGTVEASFALARDGVPDLFGDVYGEDDPADDVSGMLSADAFTFATFADAGWRIVDGWMPFDSSDGFNGDGNTLWGICDGVNDGLPFLLWQVRESERSTLPAGCDLTAVAAAPTLTCTPDTPQVGTTVTCTVTGADPDIDILWRAAYTPTFAEGVLRTTPDGTGTLTFTIPPAALDRPISVELVAWTAPLPLGTATGPIPTTIPAGDGTSAEGSLTALLAGLTGALGVAVAGAWVVAGRRGRTRRAG